MQIQPMLNPARARVLNVGVATFIITAIVVLVMALMFAQQGSIQPASGGVDPMPNVLSIPFGDRVTLEGYMLDAAELQAGDSLDLTLRWRAHQPISETLVFVVSVMRSDGAILASADAKPAWFAENATLDQRVSIPSAALAGSYQIQIEVIDAASQALIGSPFQLPEGVTVAAIAQQATAIPTNPPTLAPTAIPALPTDEPADSEETSQPAAPQVAVVQNPTAVPTPAAPAQPANSTGGFASGVFDVSGLPAYTIPMMGGGGGGGGGWCASNPAGSGYLRDIAYDEKELCIYDLPASAPVPAAVTVTLTSPGGRAYSHNYTVDKNAGGVMAEGYNPNVIALMPSSVDASMARTPFSVGVHFAAAQEHGTWSFSACVAPCDQVFASGPLNVVPSGPIYSITRAGDALDPFSLPTQVAAINRYGAGERLVFAGKGYPANQTMVIALYGSDPGYSDDDSVRRIAYYAAQVTTSSNGEFMVEFVVGNQPGELFTVHFNPQAGVYNPAPVMMQVGW